MKLEGKGFYLRTITMDDLEEYHNGYNDEAILKYNPQVPIPYTKEFSEKVIKIYTEFVEKGEWYNYGIIIDNKLNGAISIKKQSFNKALIGFWLVKEYRRKGIMTNVLKLTFDNCFNELGMNKVWGQCMRKNKPSRGLMEKSGMKLEKIIREDRLHRGKYRDSLQYEITKTNYLKNQ